MPPELAQVIALGTEPTKQNPPAGVSIQDDLEFDVLQTDVQGLVTGLNATTEMQAIGAKGPATWESVADRSYELLRDKSKDLRLASFLAVSMTHVRGFEGLHAGIEMVQGLLTNYWDTMQPPLKMLRGRVNAIDFISSKVAGESDEPGGRVQLYERKLIANYEATLSGNPTISERTAAFEELEVQTTALRTTMEAVGKLRDLLYEKFPADKIPSITSLREAGTTSLGNLDDFVRRNKPADPAAGASSAPATGAAPSGGARPAASSGGGTAALGNVALDKPEELFRMFGRAGSMLRQADPSRAMAYRLNRWALWFDWDAEPPTTDGHMTRIPEPPSMELEQPRALFAASNWMQLLNMCEERMGTAPIWLDRQFYIFTALSSMGPAFRPAAEAVRDETQQFLKRLPNLSKLAYASGMPFANDQTQQWIAQVVMVEGGGGGGGGAMGGGGAADESLAAALSEARALMNDGSYADAVRLLQHGPPPPQSARSRYTWRMALAQLATDNGKARQAAPLWEELLTAIDQYQLESWEPELCLPVYRALHRVMKGDKTRVEAAEAIFRRLCRLDPATALDS